MAADWTTYDDVAEAYAALVEPNGFAALAADLVAALSLPAAAAVLTTGTSARLRNSPRPWRQRIFETSRFFNASTGSRCESRST